LLSAVSSAIQIISSNPGRKKIGEHIKVG